MQLIGMLDSPYVRRVAISLQLLGLALAACAAWQFTHLSLPTVVTAADFPALHAYSLQAETLPEFQAAPHGEGVYRARSP